MEQWTRTSYNEEDERTVNLYAQNNTAVKYIRKELLEIQREFDKAITIHHSSPTCEST